MLFSPIKLRSTDEALLIQKASHAAHQGYDLSSCDLIFKQICHT